RFGQKDEAFRRWRRARQLPTTEPTSEIRGFSGRVKQCSSCSSYRKAPAFCRTNPLRLGDFPRLEQPGRTAELSASSSPDRGRVEALSWLLKQPWCLMRPGRTTECRRPNGAIRKSDGNFDVGAIWITEKRPPIRAPARRGIELAP